MLDSYIVSSVARISVDTAVEKLERLMEKLCGDASRCQSNEAETAARMKPPSDGHQLYNLSKSAIYFV